jgi:hypothetical protein
LTKSFGKSTGKLPKPAGIDENPEKIKNHTASLIYWLFPHRMFY